MLTETIPSYLRQVLVARDTSGSPFVFLPSLCQMYTGIEIPDYSDWCDDHYVCDGYAFPEIQADLEEAVNTSGLAGLHRRHARGIALILTQECNLGCSYCLAKQGTFGLHVEKMSEKEVLQRVKNIMDAQPDLTFIKFFGGEPTLRFDLVESICEFVTSLRPDVPMHFAITTNGTTNADRHLEVYRKFHISVSVSIDGPKPIHDSIRLTKSGRGSFDKAMEYAATLRTGNFPFAAVGVFDRRHAEAGMTYLDTIKFLNSISPLSKVQFVEALGDAVGSEDVDPGNMKPVQSEINQAVDEIFGLVTESWVNPEDKTWTYDNNIFRFLNGIVTRSAIPYTHACTASHLTTLFPSGQMMPCYTFSERKDLQFGNGLTTVSQLESRRISFQERHNWDALSSRGVVVPWYRGIVGDICVADMINSGSDYESSPFYKMFQSQTSLRCLQNLASAASDPLRLARLQSALHHHRCLTGAFTAKMSNNLSTL